MSAAFLIAGGNQMLCTVAGTCYNLATNFGEYFKQGFSYVVGDKKFQYGLLLKELATATDLLLQFEATVARMENVQKKFSVQICSLKTAAKFATEMHGVLAYFEPTKINTAQMLLDPSYYRELLKTYVLYLNTTMSGLQLQATEVLNAVELLRNTQKPARRRQMEESLRSRFQMCNR